MTIIYWCLLVCLVSIVDLLENVHGNSACMKVRITNKGLNMVSEHMDVMEMLARTIRSSSDLRHQHREFNDVEYALTNLLVTDFTEPEINIVSLPGRGLRLNAKGAEVTMTGYFEFSMKWIPYIEGAGKLHVLISGLDFSMNLNHGVNPNGRHTFAVTDYSCNISEVSISFQGGWLIFLFSPMIEDDVRRTLRTYICETSMKQVNEIVKQKWSFKMTQQLDQIVSLDFGLLQEPSFHSSYVETFHKCQVSFLGVESSFPFEPPAMADTVDNQKMTYVWISDYMFNTFGHAAHVHNVLTHKITATDLPPFDRGLFNTTCTSLPCLGIMIPDGTFPDSTMEFKILSNSNPTMTITPEDVKVLCGLKIVVYARQRNNDLADLMTLIVTIKASFTISITDALYWKINYIKLKLDEMNSLVGPNDTGFLQKLINDLLKLGLIPSMNEYGEKGEPFSLRDEFPFLRTREFVSAKPSVRFLQHAILIEDVLYPL